MEIIRLLQEVTKQGIKYLEIFPVLYEVTRRMEIFGYSSISGSNITRV